jgi:hypothetical protein
MGEIHTRILKKAVSTVTDDLGTNSVIIKNFILIVKLELEHAYDASSRLKEGVILVNRFS